MYWFGQCIDIDMNKWLFCKDLSDCQGLKGLNHVNIKFFLAFKCIVLFIPQYKQPQEQYFNPFMDF